MTDTDDVRIFLNGHIDVPDHRLDAVRAALPMHIALTRAEEGCITFDVVESDTVPGRFMVAEIFVDQAAFDAHQVRARGSEWFKVTEGIERHFAITTGGH